MKKYFSVLFFLVINILTFTKQISITVKDEKNQPVRSVSVKFNNLLKFTNSNGDVFFESNNKDFIIELSKEGYKDQSLHIFSSEKNSFDITLKKSEIKSKLLFLAVKYNEYVNSLYFLNKLQNDKDLSDNTIINFYKNNTLVKSLDFNKKLISTNLEYGIYDIKIFNIYNNNSEFKNISINQSTDNFLILNIKRNTQIIAGKVIEKKSFLGGVKIKFIDEFKNEFSTISDIEGNYSINLPENEYTVSAEKIGYKLIGNTKVILGKNKNNFNIHMSEIGSFLVGMVFDQDKKPLENVKVSFKSLENILVTQTDELGEFKASIPKGLILIKAEKKGYYTNGTLKRIENFSTLNGINIILNKKVGSIKGYVVNNIKAAKEFHLKLYDENNQFIGNSYTNESGYYEFNNLSILNKYFIKVEDDEKIYFESKLIDVHLNKKTDYNIIVDINSINLILELLNGKDILKNTKIKINNIEYTSDVNGFINQYYSTKGLKQIKINIPEYKFEKVIPLKENSANPLKIIINVKKDS